MNERRTQLGVVAPDPEDAPEPEKALAAVAPTTKAPAETFSRHFLGISLRRAYRLDIKTDEVLPAERD